MNKILIGAIGAVALSLSAPASAADLAARPYTKAPPPMVAAIYDWSGFYIGINGGGGSAHKCWDFVTPVTGVLIGEGCHNATGGTVGGQVGYRWQSANWVFGLEGQGNWADFSGDNVSTTFIGTGLRDRSKINAFGLFTGQVGYAWNNVLFYVKGGGAVVSDRYRGYDVITGLEFDRANETRWGGTVGAGLEFGFAPNWTVRRRVRSHLHGQSHHRLRRLRQLRCGSGRRFHTLGTHRSGRRYRPGPRELSLGWPGHREVLISL
ncbi:outer membrane immunogenic protein [Bradyrhizobium diazoefficiens]